MSGMTAVKFEYFARIRAARKGPNQSERHPGTPNSELFTRTVQDADDVGARVSLNDSGHCPDRLRPIRPVFFSVIVPPLWSNLFSIPSNNSLFFSVRFPTPACLPRFGYRFPSAPNVFPLLVCVSPYPGIDRLVRTRPLYVRDSLRSMSPS